MEGETPRKEIKQGRRAGFAAGSPPMSPPAVVATDLASTGGEDMTTTRTSPRPARRQGGWGMTTAQQSTSGGDEDLRLKSDPTTIINDDEETDDIPVIPDLDDVYEEDMTSSVAAPPSVLVTRVATYKELDNEFQKHAGLLTLDGEIDLKLLGSCLAPESEVFEEDKVWEWDRVFTEVSSALQQEWEKNKQED